MPVLEVSTSHIKHSPEACRTGIVTEQRISETAKAARREEQTFPFDGITGIDLLWLELPLEPAATRLWTGRSR